MDDIDIFFCKKKGKKALKLEADLLFLGVFGDLID